MTDGVTADSTADVLHAECSKVQHCPSYTCRPYVAEEVVAAVVEKLLVEGGHLLWQHHLAQKAFSFAADSALEVAVSRTVMRRVAHECGEDPDVLETEDWTIEPEPSPCERDSWMRMMLPSTAPSQGNVLAKSSSTSSTLVGKRQRRNTAVQKRQSIQRHKKEQHDMPRSWPLEEKHKIADDEERARERKAQEDAKKRDIERQRRESEKARELERARIAELHAEMDQRPHTFDMNGNVLWVEQINVAKLPKMQEVLTHGVSKNRSTKETLPSQKTLVVESQTPLKPKPKRNAKKKDDQFPDGFTRLNHAQPPLLETMEMSTGVSMNYRGKTKHGRSADLSSGKMTRQEYIMMTQREVSGQTQMEFTATGGVRTFDGNTGVSKDLSPKSSTAAKGNSADVPSSQQALPSGTGGGDTQLPAINPGRPPPGAINNASQPGVSGALLKGTGAAPVPGQHNTSPERQKESKSQALPVAPPIHLRARKFDSVGHLGRPPRLHMPSMGRLDVFGSSGAAQAPPIGATMGHGLIRHSLEEYYFPPGVLESPASGRANSFAFPRSKSDSALPREKHVSIRSPGDESPSSDGRIIPEGRSTAYRNIRKQLFPTDGTDG